jgi:hypothetical protein
VHVIWNGYDPEEELLARQTPPSPTRVLIHTGTLFRGRDTGAILAAVDTLIRNGRLAAQSVQFRFVGHCEQGALVPTDVVERGVSEGWIQIVTQRVPRPTAIEMAQGAEGLLLLQPQSATQVPGKLFEYIRIGRPILALIRRDSPIDRILGACGIPNVRVYPEHTPEQVADAVLKFLTIGSGPWHPSAAFEDTFNAVHQARALCSLIDRALVEAV